MHPGMRDHRADVTQWGRPFRASWSFLGRAFSPAGAFVLSLAAWIVSWTFIIIDETTSLELPLYLPVGAGLGVIAIGTFMGFFFWSLDAPERDLRGMQAPPPSVFERTRLAIAASFVMLYLVVVTYLLVMPAFREQLLTDEKSVGSASQDGAPLLGASGEDVLHNFSWLVGAIVGFYFFSTLGQEFINRSRPGEEKTSEGTSSASGTSTG